MSRYEMVRDIKLQDVDAAGIVFFPRFLEYCHDAYFAFLADRGFDVPQMVASHSWLLPLVHASAEFKAPLRFGDTIVVSVERIVAGTSSYTVFYRIVRRRDKRLCCTAKTVHVAVHRDTFAPLARLPDDLHDGLGLETEQTLLKRDR